MHSLILEDLIQILNAYLWNLVLVLTRLLVHKLNLIVASLDVGMVLGYNFFAWLLVLGYLIGSGLLFLGYRWGYWATDDLTQWGMCSLVFFSHFDERNPFALAFLDIRSCGVHHLILTLLHTNLIDSCRRLALGDDSATQLRLGFHYFIGIFLLDLHVWFDFLR